MVLKLKLDLLVEKHSLKTTISVGNEGADVLGVCLEHHLIELDVLSEVLLRLDRAHRLHHLVLEVFQEYIRISLALIHWKCVSVFVGLIDLALRYRRYDSEKSHVVL